MAETDTSPAALRALAERRTSTQDPRAWIEGERQWVEDVRAALTALAAEKEAGAPPPAPKAKSKDLAGDWADTLAHKILGAHCACYAEAWPDDICANECDAVAAVIRKAGAPAPDG